jgi:hypothetical protein
MSRPGRDSLRVIAGPLVAYFNNRFQELHDRIDDRMNTLYARVATEVETMSEMTLVMQRFVDVAGQEVEDLVTRMRELCDSLDRQGATPDAIAGPHASALESGFAVASVARLPPGARILHVGGESGHAGLPAVLTALGYEVSSLAGVENPTARDEGPDLLFKCALWLSGEPDQHGVDLLRKCLEPGGELVLSLRTAHGAGSVDDDRLRDWTVVERRVLLEGESVVELVRAVPST